MRLHNIEGYKEILSEIKEKDPTYYSFGKEKLDK